MAMHYLNDRLVTEDELLISPRDMGFSRGYAVFDFLRTYHHKPFKLKEHMNRLMQSSSLIGLSLPWSEEDLTKKVLETLEANQDGKEKYLKIMLSGGQSSNSMLPGTPTLIILVDDATVYPKERYTQGIGVITVEHDRYTPTAKTNNYIEGVKQYQNAAQIGAEEPIYFSKSQVYEGSNSNVFAVINGELTTIKNSILDGITRNTLLELRDDITVRDFTLEELLNATEIFLTGSGKEISPVTMINGKNVHDGNVGPITKQVMEQWREYTWNGTW